MGRFASSAAVVIAHCALLASCSPPASPPHTKIVLQPTSKVSREQLEADAAAMAGRITTLTHADPSWVEANAQQGRIFVIAPYQESVKNILGSLEEPQEGLTLHLVHPDRNQAVTAAENGKVFPGYHLVQARGDIGQQLVEIVPATDIAVEEASITYDYGQFVVSVRLDEPSGERMLKLTESQIGNQLAMVMNNELSLIHI